MKFGLALLVGPTAMMDLAVAADRLGFESVWLPDHLMVSPAAGSSPDAHDTSGDREQPHGAAVSSRLSWVDPLVMLAAMSQRTQTVMLGTWIYNLALRHPLVVARALAALDLVAPGRLLLGVASGWVEEEYNAVGVPFHDRGRVVDESLDILAGLWRQDRFEWRGTYFSIPPVEFRPKPSHEAVPILVGGESAPALHRAAARGDGWAGGWHTVPSAERIIARLRAACQAAGRDLETLDITLAARLSSPADVEAYQALGVNRLIVAPWNSPRQAAEGIDEFARSDVGRQHLRPVTDRQPARGSR